MNVDDLSKREQQELARMLVDMIVRAVECHEAKHDDDRPQK